MTSYASMSDFAIGIFEVSSWLKSAFLLGIVYFIFALLRTPPKTLSSLYTWLSTKDILPHDLKPGNQIYHDLVSISEGLDASYISGDQVESTVQTFRQHLAKSLAASLPVNSTNWVEVPDLAEFIKNHIGSALLRAFFGNELLDNNPTFLSDLWRYDEGFSTHLLNRTTSPPLYFRPQIYQIRDCLLAGIENWHLGHYDNPQWATEMMRDRYEALSNEPGQDEVSLASMDLALIRSSIEDMVPSYLSIIYRTFQSPDFTSSLRQCLSEISPDADIRDWEHLPLLSSLYDENLRLGSQTPECSWPSLSPPYGDSQQIVTKQIQLVTIVILLDAVDVDFTDDEEIAVLGNIRETRFHPGRQRTTSVRCRILQRN